MQLLENPQVLSKEDEAELRLLCAEIEHRRRVNPLSFYEHLPFPSLQGAFHDDPSTDKCLFGGNRGGKTEEAAEYALTKGLAKKIRIWLCSETFSDSVNILQRKVWQLLPKNQIAYGYYDDINGFTNRKLKLKNGTLIHFKSYDQGSQSFAQDDIDLIINDEEPPFDIYKEQRMRLIDRNGEMIISMTSTKGVTDLIADIFEDCDVIESRYSEILKESLPVIAEKNGIKFYMLWNTDNPHIDQNRLRQEVKLMTRDEIKSRIHGIPVNLSGKIYPAFNKRVHVIPFEEAPLNDVIIYHILDPHDRKPWAMQWIILHKTLTSYCIDEYPNRDFNEMISDDKTYDEYVNIIKQKEDALYDIYHKSVFKRIIDPNFGNKTIRIAERTDDRAHTTPKEELTKRGLKFADALDSLEAGHLKVREMLHYEMKGKEIVMQPKFFVADTCPNTIKHLSRYSRKDIMTADGDSKDKVGVQEKYKDYADLVRYYLMSNPKYVTGAKEFRPENQKVY
jgi:phage terminase large subunit-like protein